MYACIQICMYTSFRSGAGHNFDVISVEHGGCVMEPCKKGEFEDGTLGTYRRSLFQDRVICKSVSWRNFQPMVIKMGLVIVSHVIMILEGSPD